MNSSVQVSNQLIIHFSGNQSDMKIKQGVILSGLQIEMRPVLIEAERIWKKYGKELVVTSGLDGEHRASSLHYYGFALDLRIRFFNEHEQKWVFEELSDNLQTYSNLYRVLRYPTHIHIEYRGAIDNGIFDSDLNKQLGSSRISRY
jgi:hypothetical protein